MREIANVGAGGLRLRAVAQAVGVHHATVLYHFPCRAALVRAVVAQLEADFRRPRLPAPTAGGARADLAWEFADVRARLAEDRTPTAALIELTLAARRDVDLAKTLDRMYAGWRYHLAGIVRRGVAEGAFRGDADVGAAARLIVAQIKGVGLEAVEGAPLDRIAVLLDICRAQVEHWLVPAPAQAARTPPR